MSRRAVSATGGGSGRDWSRRTDGGRGHSGGRGYSGGEDRLWAWLSATAASLLTD